MGRRSVGPGPYSRLVLAAVAVAGATAVAAVLLRNATSDSVPPAPHNSAGSDGSSVARTTTPLAAAGSASGRTASTTAAVAVSEPLASPFEQDEVYRWLWVDPGAVRFLWRDDADVPYGQMQAARESIENRGEQVVAITNGGIHRPGLIPSGLYVEDGVELTPLNRASGSGNFFLEPNGVFWIADGRASVEMTEAYADADRAVDGAVQSGPMLVIDSAINPAFSESSTSTHRRNA
ncbi:MAG: phosphodiester glycosidase family protein, partial [Acidimicrobiia bacterium]|nr:phosphodiester glycosidase family protein [Acidimicrobiia bacterium]